MRVLVWSVLTLVTSLAVLAPAMHPAVRAEHGPRDECGPASESAPA